jgi:hypothetical protein
MVAAPFDLGDGTSWSGPGAVYLFDVSTGELLKKIVPSDTHYGQSDEDYAQTFGHSVGIDGNVAVVGARWGHNGTTPQTGSAYVFDVSRVPALPGDFNTDGTIDAADYVVWRNGLGTTYTQPDYNIWRANFGRSAAGTVAVYPSRYANSAHIPEPSVPALMSTALASLAWFRRATSHDKWSRKQQSNSGKHFVELVAG